MERTVAEFRRILEAWKTRGRQAFIEVARDIQVSAGERHGSWFVELAWVSDGLHRAAELAVTNATGLDDLSATEAYISARASASSMTRWTSTSIYERRRSLARVSTDNIDEWLTAAVRVAASYTERSLTDEYLFRSQPMQREA